MCRTTIRRVESLLFFPNPMKKILACTMALTVSAISANAAVTTLYSNASSVAVNNTSVTYTFDNPLVAGGAVSATSGSLFFSTTLTRTGSGSFSTIGIYTDAAGSSAYGGVDMGRNNNTAGFAIFDYLDHPGQASGTARVGVNSPTLTTGTYSMICEIEFTSANSGNIRAWIYDATSGAVDLSTPTITTTFTNGFATSPADLVLKLNSAVNASYSDTKVVWADSVTDRSAAFATLVPEPTVLGLSGLGLLGLLRRRRS